MTQVLTKESRKTSIRLMTLLEILEELNGVKFEWKENGLPSAGVIAQDVEKVLPELVHEVNEVKRVNYDGLIGVLIESVKTLAKRVEELENK